MKTAFLALALSGIYCLSIAADQQTATPNPIKPGMSFEDAKKTLSAAGLTGEERSYDMIIPKGMVIRYFPLNRNVALAVAYTESNGQITQINLMTSPSYQPVKDLDVYLPLREITFTPDGSFTANFYPAAKRK